MSEMGKRIAKRMTGQNLAILQNRLHETVENDFFRYKHLKSALDKMTPEQLEQQVQILPGNPTGEPIQLEPAIFIGTVEEMCHYADGEVSTETRSEVDDKHHPEQVVIGRDGPSRSIEGDTAYEWNDDNEFVGDHTGKRYSLGHHEIRERDCDAYHMKEYLITFACSAVILTSKSTGQVSYQLREKDVEEDGEKVYEVSKEVFDLFLHNARRGD
jgi:hypothetical protein